MPGESARNTAQPIIAGPRRDRAKRYRDQAGRFLELAEMETQPEARDRLLDLAIQYGELAGRVSPQKPREPKPSSRGARGRNG